MASLEDVVGVNTYLSSAAFAHGSASPHPTPPHPGQMRAESISSTFDCCGFRVTDAAFLDPMTL